MKHPVFASWLAQSVALVFAYLASIALVSSNGITPALLKSVGLAVPLLQYNYEKIEKTMGAIPAEQFLTSASMGLVSFLILLPIAFVLGLIAPLDGKPYHLKLEVFWTLLFFSAGIVAYFLFPTSLGHASYTDWLMANSNLRLFLFFCFYAWLLLCAIIAGLITRSFYYSFKVT